MTDLLVETAAGRSLPGLLLKNTKLVNVFSGRVVRSNVALCGSHIAGVGPWYDRGHEVLDLGGKYLLPGFIDAHIHIESSLLTPPSFARAVVPHGTTAVIADPHEMVNIAGVEGFCYMVRAAVGLPLDIFYTIPSCVPATPLETSGAALGPEETGLLFEACPGSPALAEMMNYPGVVAGQREVLDRIAAARRLGRMVDGHCPGLGGRELNAYRAAGISTDHECTTLEEAREKLDLGMHILIREGSVAKNLKSLLPLVNGLTYPFVSFACDDCHPADLLEEGEMDSIIRQAVFLGMSPITAIRLATINTARLYGLKGRGAVAPSFLADMVVVDNLHDFRVEMVFKNGRLVARDGVVLVPEGNRPVPPECRLRLPDLEGRLEIHPKPGSGVRVIEVQPGEILTRQVIVDAVKAVPGNDVLYAAVVERHRGTGRVGLGLVKGFGLKTGALASTVAHDSHNLLLVGTDSKDMKLAAGVVEHNGGGMAVVASGRELAALPLPVGGVMSDRDAGEVARGMDRLNSACRDLGCLLPAPFMTMSFLALPVIPELRLTDHGLVDVNAGRVVGLQV